MFRSIPLPAHRVIRGDALVLEVKGQVVRAFYGKGNSLRVFGMIYSPTCTNLAAQTNLGFTVEGFHAKKWFSCFYGDEACEASRLEGPK